MVFQLSDEISFPDPRLADEDGLLAVGGDLFVDRLLLAYSYGIFPWTSFRDCEQLHWYCPHKRFIIFPSEIHVSHSMRSLIRKNKYEVTMNKAFEEVIRKCGELRIHEKGAWLGPAVTKAYIELYRQHLAVSVEVWDENRLVGGLYGVAIGQNFFGESMFSLVPNASKLALINLAWFMEKQGAGIIDCQLETPHLRSMGGRYITYDEYLSLIGSEIHLEQRV